MQRLVWPTDVEGPMITPKYDFAWIIPNELLPEDMRLKYKPLLELFDEYDDLRWMYERNKEGIMKHSTGTTPVISALIAVAAGLTNEDLLKVAEKYAIETPGAGDVIRYLKKQDTPIYFISSSAPHFTLTMGYKMGIPSTNIYCMGEQLSYNEKRYFDELRQAGMNPLRKEVDTRFPLAAWESDHPDQKLIRGLLTEFIDNYLDVCIEMGKEYKKPNPQETVLEDLKTKQSNLFESVSSKSEMLGEMLYYLLYDEIGIMGAHRKTHVLQEIQEMEGVKKLPYVGDSIVDADPLECAHPGISVNCTNEQALRASDINLTVPSMNRLIAVIKHIQQYGADDLSPLKELVWKQQPGWGRVFLKDDIESNFDEVKGINREFKNLIKSL